MDIQTRIRQFRQMAEADPENELGHFSLGKAYLEAAMPDDAIAPLTRAVELNPSFSKAYHLLGEALRAIGNTDQAIDVFTQGVKRADELGDRMPRDAMAAALRELGAEVPQFTAAPPAHGSPASGPAHAVGVGADGFQCSRCGRPDSRLSKPPFRGELGEKIYRNVCEFCWREWIPMGTKVINELGLQLSTQTGQEVYDQHMIEFLQLDYR